MWVNLFSSGPRDDAKREHGQMQAVAATRASNEELTELALDSAIALDKRLHQQPVDGHAVTAFLDALDGIVNVPEEPVAGRLIPIHGRSVLLLARIAACGGKISGL